MISSSIYNAAGLIKSILKIRIASTFCSRFFGLMGKSALTPDTGLLLTYCASIHTMWMKFPIDLIYIDAQGTIVDTACHIKPWRLHRSKHPKSVHVLEVPAGYIKLHDIKCDDIIKNAYLGLQRLDSTHWPTMEADPFFNQRGASLIECAIAIPIITLVGLSIIQYAHLFFTKNQINHAMFMAARAGSTGNANIIKMQTAYAQALIPLYLNGRSQTNINQAYAKAQTETLQFVQIERLNPSPQSFSDWNDPSLQKKLNVQAHVISNHGLPYKALTHVKSASQQNIYDANILKIQIMHGYNPPVPLIRHIYLSYLKRTDTGKNPFYSRLIQSGRIPVISHVSIHMQSDAIESASVTPMPTHSLPNANSNDTTQDAPSNQSPNEENNNNPLENASSPQTDNASSTNDASSCSTI